MSRERNELKSVEDTEKNDISVTRKGEPIAHPKNCRTECPYGYNRSMCFPCYAKLMAEHRKTMKQKEKKA